MKVYVQFSDTTKTEVISVFSGPQDPEVFPNQAVLDDDDPRYLAFIHKWPTV